MSELICVKFLEAVDDFSKNSVQEMVYDMGMNYILDGNAEQITKEEYNNICIVKQGKRAKINIEKEAKELDVKSEILSLIAQNKRPEATEVIVQNFLHENIIYTTRDDESTRCWIYKKGIYVPEGKTYIKEYIRLMVKELYTPQLCNLIIDKIEADTYIEEKKLFEVRNPWLVCMENGVYDLKNSKFLGFSPDFFFFNKIPVIYDPKAECPSIKKFFRGILDKEEEINTMYELFGHSLLKDYKIEKMFLLTGSGRNGKGKTVELLKRFLGVENCQAISMKDLTNDPFIISELMHKLVNIGGDINNQKITDTAILKTLRGRDNITARRKGIRPITFTNYAQLVFACNEVPPIDDTSDGFWNSWIYLEFNKRFRTQKEIDSYPEEERKDYSVIDTEIIDKISTDEELSGLFNLSVIALNELLKNKGYSDTKTMEEVQKKWNRGSNSFLAFIEECCDYGKTVDGFTSKEDLRKEYNIFCREHNLKPKYDKVIKETLEKEGCWERHETVENGVRERRWYGIELK